MPDKIDPLPVPVSTEAPKEQARLPETAEQRKANNFKTIESESDNARTERRTAEFKRCLDTHSQHLKEARETYPAPITDKYYNWDSLSGAEKLAWNERRRQIDSANRAYHLAVRRTFSAHREEDDHLARVRAKKEVA